MVTDAMIKAGLRPMRDFTNSRLSARAALALIFTAMERATGADGVSERERFAAEVEEFLAEVGMRPTPFGELVGDRKFVFRLRDGADIMLERVTKARGVMREQRKLRAASSAG